MKKRLLEIIMKTPICYPLRIWIIKRRQKKVILAWEREGKPAPPPHIIKQRTLQEYARRFGLKILVETGTYTGEMVEAMKRHFDRIYSIELSKEIYEQTRLRFDGAKNIVLLCGDSGVEIGNILEELNQPALFWLDAHYSGGVTARGERDTPIYEELGQILKAPVRSHVILIDDARLFGKAPDYPSIPDLMDFIRLVRPDVEIEVLNDCIRITPSAAD